MTGRIDQTGSTPSRPANSARTSLPHSTANLDQAASEFSSLLNGGEKARQEPDRDSSHPQEGDRHSEGEQKQRSEGSSTERQSKKQPEPMVAESLLPSPDLILQNLTSEVRIELTADAVGGSPNGTSADFDIVVHQVADEVVVSDLSVGREVSIKLKESILPGTEVRLVQAEGRLQVRFVTASAESFERIAPHQQVLQSALNQKLPGHDFVVSVESDSSAFQHHPDGESRGRRDQQDPEEENSSSD
jgi:hypothetical protein